MDKHTELESANRFIADISFNQYLFRSIAFSHNEFYKGDTVEIDFRIGHNTALDSEKNNAVVSLTCTVFPDPKINGFPFTITLEMVGMFSYVPHISEDLRDSLLSENALAMMFPYVRSAISTITASAGIPPLLLPPINIHDYVNRATQSETSSE